MPPASLPDDIDALKQLVIEQRALLAAHEEQLLSRDVLIEKLRIDLLRLKRMRFGRSSEQLDAKIAQLELTLEELEASKTQIAPAVATPVAEEQSERTKPVRKALPPQLPRENLVHTPACSCESCGGELQRLGEDVSEVLEYVPSHFKVIRHVRPKFACTRCRSIAQSPAPERPIARGLAGPGLLAHVLVSKYCDHLPLYRQSEIYARSGVELERSTLADCDRAQRTLGDVVVDLDAAVLAVTRERAPARERVMDRTGEIRFPRDERVRLTTRTGHYDLSFGTRERLRGGPFREQQLLHGTDPVPIRPRSICCSLVLVSSDLCASACRDDAIRTGSMKIA